MKKILFVCTGNTCRSCMAEAIANKIIRDEKKEVMIAAYSAGIYAIPNSMASCNAVEAMKEWGIDIDKRAVRQINHQMIKDADVILTMTEEHKERLIQFDPASSSKIFTLKEFAGNTGGDISDPFGCSIEVYRRCAAELKECINKVIFKISGGK